jgi:glycosyltransferase involved in cell wall biosynthesis
MTVRSLSATEERGHPTYSRSDEAGTQQTLAAIRSISVILAAYGRREFVSEAIRSVSSQDIDLSQVELVVVTDLPEVGSPSRVREIAGTDKIRIRTVYPGPVPLGQSQSAAISASSGGIITFLNDDDLWERNRLRFISERFEKDPNLGFFHNGQSFIGPDGSLSNSGLSYALFKHPSGLFRHGEAYLSAAEAARRPWILRKFEADFNTSSMAIRRRVIEPHLHELSGIRATDDTFYLYVALASGMMILLSSSPLTRYRLHTKNVSFHSHRPIAAVAERGSALSARYMNELREIQKLVERQGWQNVAHPLLLDRLYVAMVNAVQSPSSPREAVGRILLEMLSQPLDALTWKWLVAEAAAVGHLVSPGLVRGLYSRL